MTTECLAIAYAWVDRSNGKVASAKHPGKWPTLFAFRAAFIEPSNAGSRARPVRITLPDGAIVTSEQSFTIRRFQVAQPWGHADGSETRARDGKSEEYRPDIEGLDHRDTVTDFTLPVGTSFDSATVHRLIIATLNRLQDFYPQGRFELSAVSPEHRDRS